MTEILMSTNLPQTSPTPHHHMARELTHPAQHDQSLHSQPDLKNRFSHFCSPQSDEDELGESILHRSPTKFITSNRVAAIRPNSPKTRHEGITIFTFSPNTSPSTPSHSFPPSLSASRSPAILPLMGGMNSSASNQSTTTMSLSLGRSSSCDALPSSEPSSSSSSVTSSPSRMFPPIRSSSNSPSTCGLSSPSRTPPSNNAANGTPMSLSPPSPIISISGLTSGLQHHRSSKSLTFAQGKFSFVSPIGVSPSVGSGVTSATSGSLASQDMATSLVNKHYRRTLLQASAFGTFDAPALSPGAMLSLSEVAQVVTFHRGEFAFRLGDVADHLYILGPTASIGIETYQSPMSGSPSLTRARGAVSPPIALSGFAAARCRMRRQSMPLPLPISPQPLTSIKEKPMFVVNTTAAEAKSWIGPSTSAPSLSSLPFDDKVVPAGAPMMSPTDEPAEIESYPEPIPPEDKPILRQLASPTADSLPLPVPQLVRSCGAIIGCEGLSFNPSGDANIGSVMPRRTYSARVLTDSVECLRISYHDLRTRVFPLLSFSPSSIPALADSLIKYLQSKETEGMPLKQSVPTLASVSATHDTICPPPNSVNEKSKGTGQCKYEDVDLLLHPLFQKVFYVFLQSQSSHELLEFFRDCYNFRSGYNKAQLSIEEEAKILHRAYIVPSAKKFQKHIPKSIQSSLTLSILGTDGRGAPNQSPSINRFIFFEAERHTESLLINGSLKSFKLTPAFTKILPFVKLDPRQRAKNEEARRSLTSTPTSTPPLSRSNSSASPISQTSE